MFEIIDYIPNIGESIDYFFNNILLPGDELTVFTPVKAYKFNSQAFEMFSKEDIAAKLKKTLRADSVIGNSEYRSVLRELESILTMEELAIDEKFSLYRQVLSRFERLRAFDQEGLINFANFLKEKEGQKNVFMFYQKDVVPKLKPKAIEEIITGNQERPDIGQSVIELFTAHRLLTVDRDLVSGSPTVEVAHEALLTEWPRLREWIDGSREDVRRHVALTSAMNEWAESGHHGDYLLTSLRFLGSGNHTNQGSAGMATSNWPKQRRSLATQGSVRGRWRRIFTSNTGSHR